MSQSPEANWIYSPTRKRRRASCLAGMAALALVLGGCSMSLGSLGGDEKEVVTGSIPDPGVAAPTAPVSSAPLPAPGGQQSASAVSAVTPDPQTISDQDWGYARGALSLALTGSDSGPPVPWANPDTGTRGNFAASTPVAVSANGETCREFRATRVEQGREVRLLGRACKGADGQWIISETRREPV